MRVPTVLSFANTAAQLGWFASVAVVPCARARLVPARMDEAPHIRAMYVFDIVRIGFPKNQQ
jgi:hypothetical protein